MPNWMVHTRYALPPLIVIAILMRPYLTVILIGFLLGTYGVDMDHGLSSYNERFFHTPSTYWLFLICGIFFIIFNQYWPNEGYKKLLAFYLSIMIFWSIHLLLDYGIIQRYL